MLRNMVPRDRRRQRNPSVNLVPLSCGYPSAAVITAVRLRSPMVLACDVTVRS